MKRGPEVIFDLLIGLVQYGYKEFTKEEIVQLIAKLKIKLRSDFAQVINIENGSNKLIIVLHEIYGINKHITDICDLLSEHDFDVICPNLLDKNSPYDYSQEEEAYHNFTYKLGFTHALQKVKKIILENKEHYSKIFIIGFSIGATIAWLGSQEKSVDGVVGYYGSRIRDYLYINPNCSTLLFFSIEEKSFNVNKIIPTLDKKGVRIHKCKCQHGFSDPYTQKYHKESAEYAFRETLNFLKLVE